MKGKFIVIEGGDGAGKDTQIELLKKELGERDFLFVKDPGSTDVSLKIREMVLFEKSISKNTSLFLYSAARAQLTDEKIIPALETGVHVIANRFHLSTIAYQVYGREQTEILDLVEQMNTLTLTNARPNLIIYLDCPVELGLARVKKSGEKIDQFEQQHVAFHQRVRTGYEAQLPEYNHVVIDATQPTEKVYKEVHEAILGETK